MEHECEGCGESFDNSFDFVDHLIFDNDGEEEFDPALILPSGSRFMIGSLLRFIYQNFDSPEQIKQIAESSYITLFAAEMQSEHIEEMIEDMVVTTEMMRFDSSLKSLLEEKNPDDTENGT
jgi:hypothetical protein